MIKIKFVSPISIKLDKHLIKRQFLFWKQKLIRGYSDDETWCLSLELAKFMIPRLELYKDMCQGYPGNLNSKEEWNKILDELIWYFKTIENNCYDVSAQHNMSQKDINRYNRAGKLFRNYIMALWW